MNQVNLQSYILQDDLRKLDKKCVQPGNNVCFLTQPLCQTRQTKMFASLEHDNCNNRQDDTKGCVLRTTTITGIIA